MFAAHAKSLLASIAGMFGGGGGGDKSGITGAAASAGGNAGAAMGKGLLGGIGPGILGINMKMAGIITGAATGLAALPALAGVIGLGIGTALIGGAVAAAIKGSPALKAQFTAIGTDASTMFTNAAKPLIPAISAVLKAGPGAAEDDRAAAHGHLQDGRPADPVDFRRAGPRHLGRAGHHEGRRACVRPGHRGPGADWSPASCPASRR